MRIEAHPVLRAATCVLLVACARSQAPEAAGKRLNEFTDAEGFVVQEVDLDGDGDVEVRTFFRERDGNSRLRIRKELDLDDDGRPDVVTTFDEAGEVVAEQIDSDLDGVLDWTDHYKSGVRVLSEVDTDFDGRPDLFSYYTVGTDGVSRIDRKERDTDGNGLIDTWERYDAEGNVVRTGRDLDGDGKMDLREE